MAFHEQGIGKQSTAEQNRRAKECLVREGRAHAALVFDDELCVGWCQYGRVDELPRAKFKKYEQGLDRIPDWRIPCFFVDRTYRRRKVASLALESALVEIARHGGGLVEAFPEKTEDRKFIMNFAYHGTVGMFERRGFSTIRQLSMHNWVVRKNIAGV